VRVRKAVDRAILHSVHVTVCGLCGCRRRGWGLRNVHLPLLSCSVPDLKLYRVRANVNISPNHVNPYSCQGILRGLSVPAKVSQNARFPDVSISEH
jgi:hypothetical protein